LLITLDGWLTVLDAPRFVASFRNPASVAKSLMHRKLGSGDEAFWIRLWCEYNTRLLALYRKNPFPIINFDLQEPEYLRNVGKIVQHLGLSAERLQIVTEQPQSDMQCQETPFFDPRLRHFEESGSIAVSGPALELLKDLNEAAEEFRCNMPVGH
jgi:hypothetical protein